MPQEDITINSWLLSVLQSFLHLFFSASNTSSIPYSLQILCYYLAYMFLSIIIIAPFKGICTFPKLQFSNVLVCEAVCIKILSLFQPNSNFILIYIAFIICISQKKVIAMKESIVGV